ncbi:MAG: yjgR [Bryobacterales bacterium]|nr:yjgR [Bryobacterales bacterium]
MPTPNLLIARGEIDSVLQPALINRHGLIAGATGTGKTVTLQVMAEAMSRIGVPVFAADVKGDLSGVSKPGKDSPKLRARVEQLQLHEFAFGGCPVTFWDVFGEQGHPLRATVSDLGPLLLSRILNLNETQAGVLSLVFRIADDNGLLLLDLKDLRAMLQFAAGKAKEFRTEYGNISAASVGAIQRGLLALEDQGADQFFGEPALNVDDLLQTDAQGRGVINLLAADRLMHSPQLYASFLLWLLSELFEKLPEVGDLEKPKLVFFFDEAHLLFTDQPEALLQKIELVVRLIRSKGVGVYFVTQNPVDVPETVLGQLGNRVQHALRAFTPRDQKAVRAAAETFRANPKLDIEEVITQLGVGEALVSFLDGEGIPGVVQRSFVCPPGGQIGPITAEERQGFIRASVVFGAYEEAVDRESAYELLKAGVAKASAPAPEPAPEVRREPEPEREPAPQPGRWNRGAGTGRVVYRRSAEPANDRPAARAPEPASGGSGVSEWLLGSVGPRGGRHEGVLESMVRSGARSMGSQIGGQIVRGVLGSLLGGRGRR